MRGDIKRQLMLVMLAVVLIASVLIYQKQEPEVLEVGVFAGSNWGVPDGDSYAVIDEVIKTFAPKLSATFRISSLSVAT